MGNPFDIINDLSENKTDLIRNSESPEAMERKVFNPWITNKHFSLFIDTVLYANEVNQYHGLDNLLVHDFYKYSVRSKKRRTKWPKFVEDDKIKLIAEYYDCNYRVAEEYAQLLSSEQIELIKKKMFKGGSKNDNNK